MMKLPKKADLKSSTEALTCAAQEQALRTSYMKWTRVYMYRQW